jgi:hypothetical protein
MAKMPGFIQNILCGERTICHPNDLRLSLFSEFHPKLAQNFYLFKKSTKLK